jgi:alanine dehydrogenase
MPGAVPFTSTYALSNATLPYALKLANQGWQKALASDPALLKGLNVHDGKVYYQAVADAHGLPAQNWTISFSFSKVPPRSRVPASSPG